jgi:hypothetical protein
MNQFLVFSFQARFKDIPEFLIQIRFFKRPDRRRPDKSRRRIGRRARRSAAVRIGIRIHVHHLSSNLGLHALACLRLLHDYTLNADLKMEL